MASAHRTIVAMGGGGFSMEPDNPLLDEYVVSLLDAERPKVCFIGTASGDSDQYRADFYEAFTRLGCEPWHLGLFRRDVADIDAFLRGMDAIYVGGGNTANMLAIWRTHRVGDALARAADAGVVLAGISAGANCWFEASTTDAFGAGVQGLHDGLAMLGGSFTPHYDGEAGRRPALHGLVRDGFPAGLALDDGVAAHFVGGELQAVVSSRPDARGVRVSRGAAGEVEEAPLDVRYLG